MVVDEQRVSIGNDGVYRMQYFAAIDTATQP